ncbi:MAG: hypothetical protein JW829_16145, partial [Pirellulales bacterium]|nr:hypothetical protein [Pirellulales bacterium]
LGRYLSLPNLRIPNRIDRSLALLKYGVLVVILIATWRASELVFRGFDPCYALISRHGADITVWAYVVLGAIIVASLFIIVPFCRWFCPLAAVLNPLSRFGLTRIRRNHENCSQCGLCADQCPAAIPIEQLQQVHAARCISCLNCIDCCPKKDPTASALEWWPAHRLGKRWSHGMLIGVMLLCTTFAVAASYAFPIPSFVKSHGVASSDLARMDLKVNNLTCRGRSNLLFYFLERDDLYEIPGFFRVEAWPGPGWADVVITFEKSATHPSAIKQAITEPYYDAVGDFWRNSPFRIQGYDPLLNDGPEESAMIKLGL